VSSKNVNKYLDADVIQKVENAIKNAKMKTHDQTRSELYRLALLYKYGGVYLDPMTILT
jgi:mannosyltransferase OCH1-like enzyme